MQTINFKTTSAQKIYDRYLKRVNRMAAILNKADREDVMMEINSHIFEGLQRSQDDEVEHLLNLLDSLGEPEDFLQPLVAEKKLAQATKTFNPKHIFQALMLNITKGIRFIIFSILYLSLFTFGFLIFAEIQSPQETGLFYKANEFFAFGRVNNATEADELLGFWFIPFCMVVCAICYFLITLLLRWSNKSKNSSNFRTIN